MKTRCLSLLAPLALAAALVAPVSPGGAADHRDAPAISVDAAADICDVYAFVNPQDTSRVVLAMTVNPFTVPGIAASFSPDVIYQFKVDVNGDFKEDLVIQAKFSAPGPGQRVSIRGPARPAGPPGSVNALLPPQTQRAEGPANGTIINAAPLRVFAGLRDDPFFFDLIYVFRALGLQPGGPLTRSPGIDFFAGLNVSVLAVELPGQALLGRRPDEPASRGSQRPPEGPTVRVWATTSRAAETCRHPRSVEDLNRGPLVQIDRMGFPAINTLLVGGPRKDAFNRTPPHLDGRLFGPDAVSILVGLNGDQAYSEQLARALLPDAMPLDITRTTGFLNGRRPQDDVMDAVLEAVSKGAVTGDGVNGNDAALLNAFPFFAPPHTPEETIPPRN